MPPRTSGVASSDDASSRDETRAIEDSASSPARRPTRLTFHLAALVILTALTLWTRLGGMPAELDGAGLHLTDPDTLRRLVRLQHVFNPNDPYPYRNPNDGWYADPARRGSVLHWTLPMDGVIAALDPVFSPLYPGARRFEAGAAWAGTVLGVLTVAIYYLLASYLLGAGSGFVASILFALANPVILVGGFGNGDHASLQLLLAATALLGMLALLAGRGARALAIIAGAAIGLGIWVSTETTVIWQLMALMAAASLVCGSAEERRGLALRHLEWSIAALLVVASGVIVEHRAVAWTLEWDRVSGFQLHELLVFSLFAALALALLDRRPSARAWTAPAIAAAVALIAGLLPLALSGAYRSAIGEQLAQAATVNRWAQSEISEYRSLFSVEGFFVLNQVWERLTWLAFALPFWLVAVAIDTSRRPALRTGLVLATGVLFGFNCFEMKLGHLFMIVFPITLVVGGNWILSRTSSISKLPPKVVRSFGAVVAIAFFLLADHPTLHVPLGQALADSLRSQPGNTSSPSDDRVLLDALAELPLPEGPRRAVLADWPLGAPILYYTDKPVVASGYHRNLAGIRDAYEAFVTVIPDQADTLQRILDERGVRWIVTKSDPHKLASGSRAFPELGDFAHFKTVQYQGHDNYSWEVEFSPEANRTFLWYANLDSVLAPLDLGDLVIRLIDEVPRGSTERGEVPTYAIYEVDESRVSQN